jgi:hypothetical protein
MGWNCGISVGRCIAVRVFLAISSVLMRTMFGVLGCCKASVPTNEEGRHCHFRVFPERHDVCGVVQSRGHLPVVHTVPVTCRAKPSRPTTTAVLEGRDLLMDAILP